MTTLNVVTNTDKIDIEPRHLFQIMVPTVRHDGRPYRTRFHRVWDGMVREISGGLTILTPVVGQWVDADDDDRVYIERMIPVQISCTETDFVAILDMSKVYYEQIKMYGFRLSTKVWVV